MVGAFVGIWIEINWLKSEMSSAFHAGASSMVSSVTKTAAIVCGSYLALFFPAFLLITFHPQPPCANLPGKPDDIIVVVNFIIWVKTFNTN
jgi:hypothetical protein